MSLLTEDTTRNNDQSAAMAETCFTTREEEVQSFYDVVIFGTGLVQSILASSLALIGKSVLHCDGQEFYGEMDASYNLADLISWAKQQEQQQQQQQSSKFIRSVRAETTPTITTIPINPRGSMSLLQIHSYSSSFGEKEEEKEVSRQFSLDLSPAVLFANGPAVSGLISSSVSNYVEFMAIQGLFFLSSTGGTLERVPSSKADIFQSMLLSPIEKRKFMKFLQLVMEYGEVQQQPSEESFVSTNLDTLNERQIQPCGMSLRRPQNKPIQKSSIDYLLALTSTDTDDTNNNNNPQLMTFQQYIQSQFQNSHLSNIIYHALCLQVLEASQQSSYSIKKGMDSLVRHASSLGKYDNSSAFIACLYGTSQLVQGFCRSCAVYGGSYMLRTQLTTITHNFNATANDSRTTVLLTQEQPDGTEEVLPIRCNHVIVPYDALLEQSLENNEKKDAATTTTVFTHRILRRISVIRGTFEQMPSRCIIILPPRTISNSHAIFVLVQDSSLHICPVGYTILNFCTAVTTEEEFNVSSVLMKDALNYLLPRLSQSSSIPCSSSTSTTLGEEQVAERPVAKEILQVTFSIPTQDETNENVCSQLISLFEAKISGLHVVNRPQLTITVDEAVEEAERLFQQIVGTTNNGSETTFLKMSEEVRDQVKQNAIKVEDDENDDEKDMLSSAMDLVASSTMAQHPCLLEDDENVETPTHELLFPFRKTSE